MVSNHDDQGFILNATNLTSQALYTAHVISLYFEPH